MEALLRIGTEKQPNITLDADKGQFEISGRSLPEDAKVFYDSILEWMDNYVSSPNEFTLFNFKLDYFNTASSMMIFAILLKLQTVSQEGKEVLVNWYSSEEDIKEAGIDYEEAIDIAFKHIEIE